MSELKRGIGYWTVLSLSIGSIMGTAIFFGASIGASLSGSLTIVAWLILSLISIYIAMCFGELVSMFPKSGGVYEYSKQAYGRFISFISGWVAWIVGNIAVVVLIVAAINIIAPYASNTVKILLTIAAIILLNIIAYIGIEATSIMLIGFAASIVAVIIALVAKGLLNIELSNFMSFPSHTPLSVFVTMFFLAETYFGWEAATYLAEETKDARKVIPKAMIHGTIIIALLGLGMLLISFGILGTGLSGLDSPTTVLAHRLFGPVGEGVITAGLFIALLGSAASGIITMPRLLLALARDKLMLEQLKAIHPRFNTPHKAILFQAAATLIILVIGFGNYQALLSIMVPLAVLMYIIVILAVPIFRVTSPELERLYRAPFGKVLPLAVVLFLLMTIGVWAFSTESAFALLRLSLSIILIGVPLYFLVELYYDPKMITGINDMFSFLNLVTERLSYPKGIRKEIMSFVGDLKGKTILEFGCGVGTFTIELLKAVGPGGTVYATSFSGNDLKIARKRVERKKWEAEGRVYGEARFIHDPEQFYRVHPDVPRADIVISVGVLGYTQDINRVLQDMRRLLSQDGRVCFVEYSDFFRVLPSVEWLSSDRKIEQLFRDAGFSVRVTRQRSFLWNRIFIYGFRYKGIVVI
ncbi:amino acid permease [Candidatus Woesearchaeota archaeon]|nr:amino acid permease [Candidatus Woesearchaeota archaeon]